MPNNYNISILLPTRGRTEQLTRSVISIIETAADLSKIQLIIGIDDDDKIGIPHFLEVIQPWLEEHNVNYEAHSFETMGYAGLNQYYNHMAKSASADWLFIWNDDAIMHTQNWDSIVTAYTGEFKLLKVHTHNEHPYSIFPIVPKAWFDLLGYFSQHQMIDAELSHNAYMLDLMQIVDIDVTHDQSELTGTTDNTSKNKIRFEGNPNNPYDFHNKNLINQRIVDCETIAAHLKSIKVDISWWEKVKVGGQDPWVKMRENDINKQTVQLVSP